MNQIWGSVTSKQIENPDVIQQLKEWIISSVHQNIIIKPFCKAVMGARGHYEPICRPLTVRLSITLWITYYQCCHKYPRSHKDYLVCVNLRMKKRSGNSRKDRQLAIQSYLNACVDGFIAKWFTEMTSAALT